MNVSGNIMRGNVAILGNAIYNKGVIGVLNLTFINNSTMNVKNSQKITLFASLTDDMGNAVTGQNISFFVNNTLIGNLTVIEGYGNLSYTVNGVVGEILPVSGTYSGNVTDNINILQGKLIIIKAMLNSTIIVVSFNSSVFKGSVVNLIATLKDTNGNLLNNKTVNFYFNGKLIGKAVTNSKGVAILKYTPNTIGSFKVQTIFNGDSKFNNASSLNKTLTVKTKPCNIKQIKKVNYKTKSKGKIIYTGIVTFKNYGASGSKTFNVKTISSKKSYKLLKVYNKVKYQYKNNIIKLKISLKSGGIFKLKFKIYRKL